MKYAIRIEETRGKTFVVESENLKDAIRKVEKADIDLEDECIDRKIFPSPFSMENGIATSKQIKYCEALE